VSDFQHPEFLAYRPWLIALAAIHLLLLVQQWWWQRRQFNAAALAAFGPGLSLWRGLLKWALWSAAGWMLLTALAVPLGPPTKVEGEERGADVILCVDVSSSMLAQDAQPNRLGALKQRLEGLLERLDGDRVGLVAFAGEAVVACPLTTDMDTLSLFLEKLDVDSAPRDGTGLAPAIKLALDSFPEDPNRGRLIVIGTDGEDTADSPVFQEAARAKAKGVPIFTLGMGTAAGALIPGRRDVFGRVYAKTWHGQPVHSKLDSAALRKIASLSGGAYDEGGGGAGLARIADQVRQLKQGLSKSQDRYVREPLYEKPLLWAFWLLLAESLLSARAGGWKRWGPAARKAFLRWWQPGAAVLLLLLPWRLHAGARADYNAGNQAYRGGDFQGAASSYEKSLGQGAEAQQEAGLYNLGNARYQLGDYDAAISAYQSALKLQPQDQDAQHNLDLAQRRKQQQEQQDKQSKSGKKDQQGQGGQGGKNGQGGQQNGQQAGQQNGQGSPGGQGQGQGSNAGKNGPPQPGKGSPSGQANALNQDRVQAMMNQLRLDQRRYGGAFNPLKHYQRQDRQQPQDPMEQMLEQMGMRPPRPQPQEQQGGNETKDW
jgi:Ca-activated chloride channel family protein